MVDAAADDEAVGTAEEISAAVESEANNRTAEIKMNSSPSMAGAGPSQSSRYAVGYLRAVIYEGPGSI